MAASRYQCARSVPAPECSGRSQTWGHPSRRRRQLTYNFTQHFGLEGDYGGNNNDNGSVNTVSIGPRFAWRTEGAIFFAHTLLGYNRLTVPGVDTSNGIGAILGGGMDLNVWRRVSFAFV